MNKNPKNGTSQYYNYFLRNLHQLSDDKNPGKSWVEDGHNCYCDFPTLYEDFISSCSDILTWSCLSEKQRGHLQKLYNMVESYEDYYPDRNKTDEEICQDPKWHEIREFAKEVHDELKDLFKQ